MIKTTREIVFWSNDCELEELTPRSNKKWIEVDKVKEAIRKHSSCKVNGVCMLGPYDQCVSNIDTELELDEE